jgi:hypothetical protein
VTSTKTSEWVREGEGGLETIQMTPSGSFAINRIKKHTMVGGRTIKTG